MRNRITKEDFRATKPPRTECLTRRVEGEGINATLQETGFREWWNPRSYKGETPGFLAWGWGVE